MQLHVLPVPLLAAILEVVKFWVLLVPMLAANRLEIEAQGKVMPVPLLAAKLSEFKVLLVPLLAANLLEIKGLLAANLVQIEVVLPVPLLAANLLQIEVQVNGLLGPLLATSWSSVGPGVP